MTTASGSLGLIEAHPGTGLKVLPITTDQSGKWLAAGWRDFKSAPGVSLTYGGCFTLFGIFLTLMAFQNDMPYVVLPLMAGFMLIAPIFAVGFMKPAGCMNLVRLSRSLPRCALLPGAARHNWPLWVSCSC